MNHTSSSINVKTVRPRLSVFVAGAIFVFFVAAFLAVGWIRSQQEHDTSLYPSEIDLLAKHRKRVDPLAEAQQRGRKVYAHYCAICHGSQGKGDGFNAALLAQRPRNFTDPNFWKQTTDERVFFAITKGGPSVGKSVLMPAWGGTLSQPQIRDVIAFLHRFSEKRKRIDD